jgi:hypothetical protein
MIGSRSSVPLISSLNRHLPKPALEARLGVLLRSHHPQALPIPPMLPTLPLTAIPLTSTYLKRPKSIALTALCQFVLQKWVFSRAPVPSLP